MTMYESDEFDIKLQIIRNADLEDVKILSVNYSQLVVTIDDELMKSKYIELQKETAARIRELNHG